MCIMYHYYHCELPPKNIDTYIAILTPSIFGHDIAEFGAPATISGFLIPVIAQSSLLDPPFVV